MRINIGFILIIVALTSCEKVSRGSESEQPSPTLPLAGTWKLLSGTIIENNDTTVTDYTTNREFIKIINETHFAFLLHDLNKGQDSLATYSSGGGHYTLTDSAYTERLEYCTDRQWEGNEFHFTVTIKNDTLIQKGVEKIEDINVDRINIEKYVRVKD
jgi:hypothetical protein